MSKEGFPGRSGNFELNLKEKLGVSQRRKNQSIPGKDKKNIQKYKAAWGVLRSK